MNSETFTQFLKTPAYLYRISYQELKSLVVQYPYCQNLRYLLLKKSQADQHTEYERNLQMAATYSVERSFLYEQLYNNESIEVNRASNVATNDAEVLELKNLETLDLTPQKEVLYVTDEIETDMTVSTTTSPPLDLNTDVVNEAELPQEEIPVEATADFDDFFSEVFEDETSEDETSEDEVLEISEGHQVSEMEASAEEEISAIVLPEVESDNLEIIEDSAKEEILEVTPEATSDDIEDLFSEEIKEISVEQEELGEAISEESSNDKSLGLDMEDLNETPTVAQLDTPIKENLSSVMELTIEQELSHSEAVELTDLAPTRTLANVKKEEEEEIETETEVISPHSSFSNWLKQFNSPQISVEIEDLDNKEGKKKVNYKYELVKGEWKQIKTKVKKKKKKSKAELIAAESVKLSKDVATETLAQLLEKQEHYSKAIKMYEQLSLEIPEKSDYFASRIKALLLKL